MLKEVRAGLYNQNKSDNKLNIFLNAIIVLVILVLVAEIYFMANYSGVYVVGESMEPTLTGADSKSVIGGDYVYINKHAKPDYGDIVVVFSEKFVTNGNKEDGYIIKRAVAFGGDSVKIIKGQLYIRYSGTSEFVPVDEDYVDPDHNDPNEENNTFADDDFGYLVQEGHVFLLGDNRNRSFDSRKFDSLPIKNVDGVVTEWSFKHKSFCTSFQNFFKFKLPGFFKLK